MGSNSNPDHIASGLRKKQDPKTAWQWEETRLGDYVDPNLITMEFVTQPLCASVSSSATGEYLYLLTPSHIIVAEMEGDPWEPAFAFTKCHLHGGKLGVENRSSGVRSGYEIQLCLALGRWLSFLILCSNVYKIKTVIEPPS